jgi:microcystin-dependent protein
VGGQPVTDFYIGQILQGGWNFAPNGTALCNGQTMSISQNNALFSLLGTTYGGNGQTTFQLPNLQGRSMVHWGQSPGTSNYVIGESAGVEQVTLTQVNLPAHSHSFSSTSTFSASGGQPRASAQIPSTGSVFGHSVDVAPNATSAPAIYCPSGTPTSVQLGGLNVAGTIGSTGNNIPVQILNPYLAITMIITLVGIFPSRN